MQPLFRQLLGSAFDRLPLPIRQVHSGESLSLRGACAIKRGNHWSARMAGGIAGMPPAANESPLTVRIDTDESGEIWTRHFGTRRMQSRLTARRGLLVEKLGPLTMFFELRAAADELLWIPRAGRVLGIPLPAGFFAGINAVESVRDNRYCFDVGALLPLIGPIVHYRGWLHVDV